jgi:hypothetical protein
MWNYYRKEQGISAIYSHTTACSKLRGQITTTLLEPGLGFICMTVSLKGTSIK